MQDFNMDVVPPVAEANASEMKLQSPHHLRALYRKTCMLQLRQYKTNCCQLFIPVLLMGILGIGTFLYYKAISYDTEDDIYLQYSSAFSPNGNYTNIKYSSSVGNGSISWGVYADSCGGDSTNMTCTSDYLRFIYADPSGEGSAILANLPKYTYNYYVNSSFTGYISVPTLAETSSASTMDDTLMTLLEDNANSDYDDEDYQEARYALPNLGLVFNDVTFGKDPSLSYILQTQFQEDYSLNYVSYQPNIWETASMTMGWIASSFLQNILGQTVTDPDAVTITAIPVMMPQYSYSQTFNFVAVMTAYYLPMAIGFAMPTFVYMLVYEKSEKLFSMMKMMGMSRIKYYCVNYSIFYAYYSVMTTFVCVMGFAVFNPLFLQTNPAVWLVLWITWGFAQVSLSFLLGSFFSSTTSAAIVTYLLWFFSYGLGGTINQIFFQSATGQGASYYLLFLPFPPFAMTRGVYLMTMRIIEVGGTPYSWGAFNPTDPMFIVYLYLMAEGILIFLLAVYLDQVIPQANTVRKSPLFCFKPLLRLLKKNGKDRAEDEEDLAVDESIQELGDEDEDVVEEAQRARDSNFPCVLRVKGMKKVYSSDGHQKLALRSLYLTVSSGECFGLLGPNGAGKTTLASILTGLQSPTSGTAEIAGYVVPDDIDNIHQFLGFCPQHDVLWSDLTIEEHLLFYCRLKGVPTKQEKEHVHHLATNVHLHDDLKKKVKQLSGGMKRRLSLAISLIGHPKVVLLDEPTTGLDPASRRQIWDIIAAEKMQRSTIITTHNMEEADVLCTRIGILSRGRLLCVGPQLRLKNKFGGGYKLSVSVFDMHQAEEYVRSIFPGAITESVVSDTVDFTIAASDFDFPRLSRAMQAANQHGIKEWGVNQTSLEEVFLRLISTEEADPTE